MIHQPAGGTRGQASDIKIQAERIIKIRSNINRILSDATGKPIEVVEHDSDRDTSCPRGKRLPTG